MANKDYHVVLQVELTLQAPSKKAAWSRADRIEAIGCLGLIPTPKVPWLRDIDCITVEQVELI